MTCNPRLLLYAICALALGACAQTPTAPITPPATPAATPPPTDESARPLVALGAGDVIEMQVLGRPELATTTSIADDGSVVVPLVGSVKIAGLSTHAAAEKVATAFRDGQYLRNPQVSILISQERSQLVSVLGEVQTPGRFPVSSATTVLDLLAQAGGTTENSGQVMYIIRQRGQGVDPERRAVDLRGLKNNRYALQSIALQGGDSVYVPPAEQFYIYGEVQQPSVYRLEPNMTVLQAISRSGGLTKLASHGKVRIKRRDAETGELVTRKAGLHEIVQADDVIYVKESVF